MAGSHGLFHRQDKVARKGTRSDANERHAERSFRLTGAGRQRPLHGPVKINVSVSAFVALTVTVHMESCTIYHYFLDFFFFFTVSVSESVSVRTEPPPLNLLINRCSDLMFGLVCRGFLQLPQRAFPIPRLH